MQAEEFDSSGNRQEETYKIEQPNKTDELHLEAANRNQLSNRNDESHLIQIKASNDEIDRRIAAFIEQKRQEVDEYNRKEFCSVFTDEDPDDSCARVNAVFLSRPGGKSHIKVSKVVNLHGPQTQITSPLKIKEEKPDDVLPGVEERLRNIEEHLKIKTGPKINKTNVYSRLKQLENRILYLEGISPEYFDHSVPPQKQRKVDRFVKQETSIDQELSLDDIDAKMSILKEKLKRKFVSGNQT